MTQKLPTSIGVTLLLALGLAACQKQAVAPPAAPPTVTVAKPARQPVTIYYETTGTSQPSMSVNLAARVEGFLDQIKFDDGSFVKKGQELFVIEQLPYQTKLQLNEAQVAQSAAQLKVAQSEYDRQTRMVRDNATSQAQVEKYLGDRDAAVATLAQSKANVVTAQINLGYTSVAAPFDGRVGRHMVDAGNVVGNGTATTLATIEKISPLYIMFAVDEVVAMKVRTRRAAEIAARKAAGEELYGLDVPVEIGAQGEEGYPHAGKLNFIDTGLNAQTGTLQLRAEIANADRFLMPGLFVRIRIPVGREEAATLVPDRVIAYDQTGPYVLVVGDDQTVSRRPIKIGAKDGSQRIVTSGLDANDRVVVNGIQSAIPGRKVTAVEESAAPAKN